MRLKHRLTMFAVTILAMSAMATNAYATSTYDDVFHQGNFLVKHGNCVADVAPLWSSAINDPDKWVSTTNQSTIASHFATALSNETGWAVIQREAKATHSVGNEDFTAGDRYLTVLISANPSTELSFTTNGDYGKVLLPNTSVDVVQMALTGGSGNQPCEFKVIGSGVYQSAAYSPFGMEDNNSYVFSSLVRYDQVLVNFTINYPTGYEGELISAEAPPAKYVAMGDSFSSGEGNPPFENGTNEVGVDECHRSSLAYPRLLEFDSNLGSGSTAFVACSGATTKDVLGESEDDDPHGKWDEPSQVDALSEDTEVVTITIGGNDIKFKEFALACIFVNCASTSDEYQESWDIMTDSNRSDYLPDRLEDVFAAMANKLGSSNQEVKVYVVGYPKVITQASWIETTSSDPNNCLYMSEDSASATEAIIAKLNDVISTAVDDYDDPRFVYVDPLVPGSLFIGNELCRSEGYFNGVEAAGIFGGNDAYVFHPNKDGQGAYKQIMSDAMN